MAPERVHHHELHVEDLPHGRLRDEAPGAQITQAALIYKQEERRRVTLR